MLSFILNRDDSKISGDTPNKYLSILGAVKSDEEIESIINITEVEYVSGKYGESQYALHLFYKLCLSFEKLIRQRLRMSSDYSDAYGLRIDSPEIKGAFFFNKKNPKSTTINLNKAPEHSKPVQ